MRRGIEIPLLTNAQSIYLANYLAEGGLQDRNSVR